MIIDGHAHLGGDYRDLETIKSTLVEKGVDKVILSPADSARQHGMPIPDIAGKLPNTELNFVVNRLIRYATVNPHHQANIESGNKEIFKISSESEGRVIQFFWANPLKDGIIDEIESGHNAWKFKGLKLHQGSHSFNIKSSAFLDIAKLAEIKGIPVFIHLYSKKEVSDFIQISGNFKTAFIIGHLIGQEIFTRLKKEVSDNVYFDISCPPLVSFDRIKKAVNDFGPGRIIMGSDTPYGTDNIGEIISRVRRLKITRHQCDLISGDNIRDLLNL